jgi:hypothetical protein
MLAILWSFTKLTLVDFGSKCVKILTGSLRNVEVLYHTNVGWLAAQEDFTVITGLYETILQHNYVANLCKNRLLMHACWLHEVDDYVITYNIQLKYFLNKWAYTI